MPRRIPQATLMAAATLLVTACGSGSSHATTATSHAQAHTGAGAHARDTATDSRANRLTDSLARDEQAGQLVMTAIVGTTLDADTRDQLERAHLGGVILFGFNARSPRQLRRLSAQLQDVARRGNGAGLGMLVAADQEGGAARGIGWLPTSRSEAAVGRMPRDAGIAFERTAGRTLRSAGITIDLAPVADVAGGHHVMDGRAASTNPDAAARAMRTIVTGLQGGGIAATAKHFPGLGAATRNTDQGTAKVALGANDLASQRAPFDASIDAGVDAVMLSHATYTALDPHHPASVSPAVVSLLRDDLGFSGVVITDSLNAKGLRDATHRKVPDLCADAVAAGADIALVTGSLETARLCRNRILTAVRDGRIPRERLRDAAAHVVALKLRLGLAAMP